jgi:general secretion pathway protein E
MANMDSAGIAPRGPDRLPFGFAKRHQVLLEARRDGQADLVVTAATRPVAVAEAQRFLGLPVRVHRVSDEDFANLLSSSYQADSADAMQVAEGLGDTLDLASLAESVPQTEDLMEQEDDAPIIRLINALLGEAVRLNASDIHIETYERRVVVRMRVDGVLREVVQPRRELAPLLVSRIKVMARLDIAEKRIPQDGRISVRVAGREIDVRVSTMPGSNGERVVLRLLDKRAGRLDLAQLGMAAETCQRLDTMIHKPHGIILVTGPTGSGKTTTLYAALGRLNDRSRNILTVEDPVEYQIDGIGQTQVNTKVDMTFARGLRAILRQDPDVVMVGEIRDLETAEIAVQASLTGHLVLSTLHTNTAVGAVTRLVDMGVEPFLLSSSLLGVLAQRLVRVLCSECREPYAAKPDELALFGVAGHAPETFHRAKGCPACNMLGYRGRTGIYELVEVDHHLRELVHNRAGEHELEAYARRHSPGMRDDGLRLVRAGVSTVEEVLRVTRED